MFLKAFKWEMINKQCHDWYVYQHCLIFQFDWYLVGCWLLCGRCRQNWSICPLTNSFFLLLHCRCSIPINHQTGFSCIVTQDNLLMFKLYTATSVDHSYTQNNPYPNQRHHWCMGENCFHPDFKENTSHLKKLKIQMAWGVYIFNTKAVSNFCSVLFVFGLWSGCILKGIILGGCYPGLSALCWGRKQWEGSGSPLRRGQ